jgi:hypothetical protein
MKKAIFIAGIFLMFTSTLVFTQTGSVKGFVYDATSGQPLALASVAITGFKTKVVTDADGFFMILKVPAGDHLIRVSYIGFEDFAEIVTIENQLMEQIVAHLKPQVVTLQTATVNAERRRMEHLNPVSAHHITQESLKSIPGLTGQSDLAEYLQVIPGIIFTGDRGGQFYVRGGAPVQNQVKLDGMTVVNPFHSIGFSSVFDTEIIGSVDVYTAGFGAKYGGRTSSVIDVKTRMGNRREFKAKASGTTFGYGLTVEGPLKKMTEKDPSSISVMLSNKGSYIQKSAGLFYPYLDSAGIPFNYNDLLGKVSFVGRKGDQLDLIGMHFTDAADYSGLMRSTWENNGGGFRFLVSPSNSRLLFEQTLFYSDYSGKFLEASKRPRSTRYNSLEGMFKVFFNGPLFSFVWGTEMNVNHTKHNYASDANLLQDIDYYSTELITFLDSRIEIARLLIEPGFRLHYYADNAYVAAEPRLKVRFKINDLLNINFATGLYSQNLVSTTSPEDVISLFQGYYIGPGFVQDTYRDKYIDDKISLAWHAVCGLSYYGPKNLKLSVEGYVKDYYRMINSNRYKKYDLILTANNHYPDYLIMPFIIEQGWAYGIDFLADWNTELWNLYAAYSLGYVTRQDEFMDYVPHFDRRHNMNFVAGYKLGHKKGWELKARWNLGSGFPFTQSYGMYENLVNNYGQFSLDLTTSGEIGILYGPINGGRLPWYHRLDISLQKAWIFRKGHSLEVTASIMNLYNRLNVFYVDRITMKRINQLPILPTLGLSWRI